MSKGKCFVTFSNLTKGHSKDNKGLSKQRLKFVTPDMRSLNTTSTARQAVSAIILKWSKCVFNFKPKKVSTFLKNNLRVYTLNEKEISEG
jgi:hypothetical protein